MFAVTRHESPIKDWQPPQLVTALQNVKLGPVSDGDTRAEALKDDPERSGAYRVEERSLPTKVPFEARTMNGTNKRKPILATLADLLAPVSTSQFLNVFRARKRLHIAASDYTRAEPLLSWAEIDAVLFEHALDDGVTSSGQ
jgi:hypothetical protein